MPRLIVPASMGCQRKFESRTAPRRRLVEKPIKVLQPADRPDFQAISSFPSDLPPAFPSDDEMNQPSPTSVPARGVVFRVVSNRPRGALSGVGASPMHALRNIVRSLAVERT